MLFPGEELTLQAWLLSLKPKAPALFVNKSALYIPADEVNNFAAPGETVEYHVVAINNGNVDLTAVVVEDPMFEGRLGKPESATALGGQPIRVQDWFDRMALQSFSVYCRPGFP